MAWYRMDGMRGPKAGCVLALVIAPTLLSSCMWYPRSMDARATALHSEIDAARRPLQAAAAPYLLAPNEAFALGVDATPLNDVIEQYDRVDHVITLTYQSAHAADFFSSVDKCYDPLFHLEVPGEFQYVFAAVSRIDAALTFRLSGPSWTQESGFEFSADLVGAANLLGVILQKQCFSPPGISDFGPGTYPFPPAPPLLKGYAGLSKGKNGDLEVDLTLLDPVTASVFRGAKLAVKPLLPVTTIPNPLKNVVRIKYLKDKPPLCLKVEFDTNKITNLAMGPRLSGTTAISKVPPVDVDSCPDN